MRIFDYLKKVWCKNEACEKEKVQDRFRLHGQNPMEGKKHCMNRSVKSSNWFEESKSMVTCVNFEF